MLTQALIDLIKYIVNNEDLTIQKLVQHESKSLAYIRNEIAKANQYLPDLWKIAIKKSAIFSAMTYPDYLDFMKQLTFQDYLPSQEERFRVIILLSYFREYVNLTELYQIWNISLTTKKNDMKQLARYLAGYQLRIIKKPGFGIRITGNMLRYRVLLVTIISKCIDVFGFQIHERGANTPLESQIYHIFLNETSHLWEMAQSYILTFLHDYGNKINYYSKKFFLIYVILALYPQREGSIEYEELRLKPLNLYLFPIRSENIAFNQVVSMIDFDPMMPFPHNERLYDLVEQLFETIQAQIRTHIHTREQVIEELYGFIYRQYFFNYFQYYYDDKLVMNTVSQYPHLYPVMQEALREIEEYLDTSFNDEQISSLTLIFAKWITKNRLHGRNAKRIVVVTNVATERVSYFLEKLRDYIEFRHVATIDVNELDLLQELEFDLIISFSNRTVSIIREYGYQPIKLKFFVEHDDIMALMDAGCSIARRRILASDLVDELYGKTRDEQIAFLRSRYESLFL